MPNDLDPFDAIQQTQKVQQEAAAAPRDAFAEINGQADPLRATAYLGAKMAPERAAKVIALRDRTRLPADLVDRNLEEVELEARRSDFNPDEYRKTSPKVAAWLAEQPEHFAIASDDLPRLAAMEKMVSESQDYAFNQGGSISGPYDKNGYRKFYRNTADMMAELRRDAEADKEHAKDVAYFGKAVKRDFGIFAPIVTGAIGAIDSTASVLGIGDERTRKSASLIAEASQRSDPGLWNDIQRGVGGVGADLPLMLAGAALAPLTAIKRIMGAGKLASYAAGATATGIAVQPLAIREGIITGRESGWANGLAAWGIETVIPAAFGTTGADRIIETLAARGVAKEAAPSLARVAGRLLLDAGLEGTEESVTELAHALHEVGSGINPSALDPDQLWPRLAVAGSVGAIAGGGFNLPGAIASLSQRGTLDRDANRLIQAASGQQMLAGVIQAAQESATAGRSPEAARTLFQSMLNDKVPQVYLDREAWDAHFQSLNQDPRAKAAELMGDGAKAYDEAARTGAPLTLQTGSLVVDVAKDKATGEWIIREARLDPGMMNAREAEDAVRALETLPDDPEQKAQQTAQEAAQAVQEDVEQQLTAAGYDGGSARRSAVQMAAVFRTMAARWNAGRKADDANRTDARQLFLEWNVGINRPVAEVLAKPTMQTAAQVIAAMRAKIADARLATVDAGRLAAQGALDQADVQLAQAAAGQPGDSIIAEATARLASSAATGLGYSDAMRVLGPDFGFKPDAAALTLTPEQIQRGNLLSAALRIRGGSLVGLIEDAGAGKASPVATTAAGPQAETSPELEKLTAAAFHLESIVTALRAGKGDLAQMEQATALAAEVGPVLDSLKLDQARTDSIRAAVEFAQDGQTLNQPAYHGTGNPDPYDRFAYDRVGGPGGEGAQAYGWGLYFTSMKSVAAMYRRMLAADAPASPERLKAFHEAMAVYFKPGRVVKSWNGYDKVVKYLPGVGASWSVEVVASSADGAVDRYTRPRRHATAPDAKDFNAVVGQESPELLKELNKVGGRLYAVEIPDDGDMLDWDKRLSQQDPKIRAVVEKVARAAGVEVFPAEMTGGGAYWAISEMLSPERKKPASGWDVVYRGDEGHKAASDALLAAGIPGITYFGEIKKTGGKGTQNYVIFDDSKVAIKSYEQPNKRGPRGSIAFGRKDGVRQTDIRLFEHADLSTVLHESGHLYLELLIDLAGREGAPADIKGDLSTAMSWLGVADPNKITVEQHEQWARGFEAYLLKGDAPSAELRGAFARFAAWMAAIYKSVKNLSVNLTPEVRGVFDRLLATQEEIADASAKLGDDPVFADAKAAGMSDADFATYQKARNESRQMAEDALRTEAMREITRERTAAWKDLEREVGQEVELETNRAKEYVAAAILRTGALPGGVPLPPGTPALKLDSADLRRRIENKLGTKDERKAALDRMTKMHAKEGGVAVDDAAKLLGFDSGDALLNAMLTLRNRVEVIKAETAVRMRNRFGDVLTDGTIAEKAMASLHNERRADVHLAEVRALATRVGKKVAPIEVLREAARKKIDSMPVKDILPSIFARSEAKARRALEKALAKQDFAAAWNAKQLELLNHEMYRAAIDAKREGDSIAEYAKKFNEKKKREDIGKAGGWEWTVAIPDGTAQVFDNEDDARKAAGPGGKFERTSGYLEKIDDLLERYEFREVTNKAIARRQTLRQWADAQMAAGIPVPIPAAILDASKRTNWRQVPISELRAVRDTLALINKLAKHQNQLSKASREAKLSQVAADLMRTLLRTHPKAQTRKIGEKPGYMPRFLAHHRKAANIARQMDGDEDGGPFWDALIRPVNEAATAESAMLREAKATQEAIWGAWEKQAKNDGWPPGERRQFDGFEGGLDRLGAIMVALNWGNDGNRERLLEGGGGGKMYNKKGDIVNKPLTDAQVGTVLDSLSAADWNLVEGVWDHIDSYWSEIKALEQRVSGVAPEKVVASPFPTKHGVIKGGYFPVMYDGQETGRIDGEAQDLAKQLMAQAYGSTQTAHGHAKERTQGQGRRLDLDPAVIGKHLTRVAHDLTHREAVADALRIIMHPNVRATIDSRMGQATTRQLRQWVADIAAGPPTTDGARFLGFLRRGFSISTMGFRTMTAAIQLTGFANSISRVGAGRMTAAIGTLFSGRDSANAWRFVNEKSAMMRERLTTQTREINETLGQFQRSRFEKAQAGVARWAFWPMQRVQSAVDTATWLAAYDKAQVEQRGDVESIAIADQAVIDTQGSGLTKDLSGVQRDQFLQVFTGAYTYGATLFNQVYDQGARVRRNPKDFGTWASAFGNTMLVAALPAAMTVIIRGLTRDWWDDKEEKDPFAERAANEFASSMMGTMVGTRELGGIFSGFGYSGPAVVRPFGDALALATQIKQMDADAGLAKAIISTAGSWAGLPSGQAIATGSGLWQWLEDPSADVRPIIFGPSTGR